MLKRQIDVRDEPFEPRVGSNEVVAEAGRMSVEQANPAHAVDPVQSLEQPDDARPSGDVHAVGRRVLPDEVELPHAELGEGVRLGEDLTGGSAVKRAPDRGNRAVAAAVVAPIGDA